MDLMDIARQVPTTDIITDRQTVIVQYDNPNDIDMIRAYIRSLKHHQAESIINDAIRIDCFIALEGLYEPKDEWVRIIYHCTRYYTNPMRILERFPGCLVLQVDEEYLNKWRHTNDNTRGIPQIPSNKRSAR